jgi:hypothetical protein
MKNTNQKPGLQLSAVVKFVCNAFKSIFASESKNEFVRLKNFIAS